MTMVLVPSQNKVAWLAGYALVCQALEAPKPRMDWFVTVASIAAVPAKRAGATTRNAKNKKEFPILFQKVSGFKRSNNISSPI